EVILIPLGEGIKKIKYEAFSKIRMNA
ncbi:hypothetical protein A2U01_0066330, partial [Trifolium medium]|nr:hypothetical protein [Trifolium medium]